jgi:branched-chain amino acid transport system ATP-binding protein
LGLKLTASDVEAAYGAVRALHGVSIELHQGETVALLGTNGNGKSTLMRCLLGMVRPTRGRITLELDGEAHDLAQLSTEEIVNLGVAMVPEGRRLFPKLTVEENLLLGAYRKAARADITRNLQLAYTTFPVLAERGRQLAGTMSGGQQQMLAIARALMTSPRLLLVDEPSVGLAPLLVSQVIAKIGELKRTAGLTVLVAEQNFAQTVRIADRGYVIVHGKIAFEGKSVAELQSNELIRELYLGGIGTMVISSGGPRPVDPVGKLR